MIPDSQIERWLQEDLGHHDVTNDVPGTTTGAIRAREDGTIAGLAAASAVFEYLDVDTERQASDGSEVSPGETVVRVRGPARAVLRGERVAVNLLGHASGIATRTQRAVTLARQESDSVEVAATRKTTPGLRGLEKRAVAAGGGDTHRLDLSQMVMIKDNHVAELGIEGALERFQERASFATKIEVEVETPDQALRAVEAGADVVLLDNMSPATVEKVVDRVSGGALFEASGGITLETLPEYAGTGVDVVSMGSLTHSAPALDFSMKTDV